MAGVSSAIMAGMAVAGAGSSILGGLLGGGPQPKNNTAAMNAITMADIQRLADYDRKANEISKWYGDSSSDLFNDTLNKTDPAAQAAMRSQAEATRTKAGVDLINGAPTATNAFDNAPDSSGAVRSANALELAKALDLGRARAAAGAKVNSYSDAGLQTGINLTRGAQQQGQFGEIGMIRNRLNQQTHTPIMSAETKMAMAGQPSMQGGSMLGPILGAGGNLISAAGAYGLGNYFGGFFKSPGGGTAP